MDSSILWKFLFIVTDVVLVGALSWQVFLFNASQKNKDEIAALRLHIAEHYARKDDFEAAFARLEGKLDKLFEELHKRTNGRGSNNS